MLRIAYWPATANALTGLKEHALDQSLPVFQKLLVRGEILSMLSVRS